MFTPWCLYTDNDLPERGSLDNSSQSSQDDLDTDDVNDKGLSTFVPIILYGYIFLADLLKMFLIFRNIYKQHNH